MLPNTTNMNGGMWQTRSLSDVSSWLLSSFLLLSFSAATNTCFRVSQH
jgi:hypothetical protein